MPEENNPFQLYADPFTRNDLAELVHFDCGSEDSWARTATEWIVGNDVWESIEKRKTKVWLYRNESGVIVGYGSLGLTRRKWPPPDGGYVNLLIVPMLGMDYRFHGQPPDPNFRYSNQIISHLRFEAIQVYQSLANAGGSTLPLPTLFVHRDNVRAIRLYERFGFAIERAGTRNDHLLMIQRIDSENET